MFLLEPQPISLFDHPCTTHDNEGRMSRLLFFGCSGMAVVESRNEKKAILWEGIGQRANTCNIRTNSRAVGGGNICNVAQSERPPPAPPPPPESDRRPSRSKWESFHHPSRRADRGEEIKYTESELTGHSFSLFLCGGRHIESGHLTKHLRREGLNTN